MYKSTTLENVSKANVINTADVFYGNVMSQRFNGVYDGEFSYYKLSKKNICHQAIFFKKSVFETIGLLNLKYKSNVNVPCASLPHASSLHIQIVIEDTLKMLLAFLLPCLLLPHSDLN